MRSGQLDDACATMTVSGLTAEPVAGLVERNGRFWVEGLPLLPGANGLTLTATDAAVQGNLGGDGYGNTEPESTDECLNTAVNALLAAGRVNPRNCTPVGQPLQIADFSPGFRSPARKLVVLITDAPPGGFCDEEDGGVQAHQYALQARQACIQINAILVNRDNESPYPAAIPVMQDYYQTSCGWYSNVPHDGGDLAGAILKMFYEDGYCNCP